MQKSAFFNSRDGDRRYKAEDFAEYFATFIGNGVFPNPSTGLQVLSNGDMAVNVGAGKAWINGYFYTAGDQVLSIALADGVLPRIDRVVVRWSLASRDIVLAVKQGAFATNPVAPPVQRDADVYELALADISIGKGATSILQMNITDLRLNPAFCGIVHGLVNQVDTTTLAAQLESWFEYLKTASQAELDAIYERFDELYDANVSKFENQLNTNQGTFDTWLATIQEILNEEVAANLLKMINEKQATITATGILKGNGNGSVTSAELEDFPVLSSLQDRLITYDGSPLAHTLFPSGEESGSFWTTKKEILSSRDRACTIYHNGKIYLISGVSGSTNTTYNKVDIYDVEKDTWTAGAIIGTARYNFQATLVGEEIYVTGGLAGGSSPAYASGLNIYSITSGTWASQGSLPGYKHTHQAVLHENKIYLIGGYSSTTTVTASLRLDIYNVTSKTWTQGANMPTAGGGCRAILYQSKIYVIGGSQSTKLEVYDIEGDTWETKASMTVARENHFATLIEGKIYVVGGTLADNKTLEIYDIASDTWAKGADIPESRYSCPGVVRKTKQSYKIYILGGRTSNGAVNGTPLTSVHIYDTKTDTWTADTMQDRRAEYVPIIIDKKIYVMAGSTGTNSYTSANRVYNIEDKGIKLGDIEAGMSLTSNNSVILDDGEFLEVLPKSDVSWYKAEKNYAMFAYPEQATTVGIRKSEKEM